MHRSLMEVVAPGMIKEIREVPRAVEEWEMKCARIKLEYGEKEGS